MNTDLIMIEKKLITISNYNYNKKYIVNYKQELNKQQLIALSIIDRPLLVIAGPGTGKTTLIKYKVSYLIEEGIKPSEILLLTFTKKTSEDMLKKVKSLLSDIYDDKVQGGTFHSFANRVLREHSKTIGLDKRFTIIDVSDSKKMINDILSEIKTGNK